MGDENSLDERTITVARKLNENISAEEPITWDDVQDELSSGDWGHAIQEGLVEPVEEGAGYTIQDIAYDENDAEDISLDMGDTDYDEPKWTKYDKGALAVVLLLVVGYWSDTAQNAIGGTVDIVLGPINSTLPFFAVLLFFAFLTSVYSTVLQSKLTDQERLNKIKARLNILQDKQDEELEDMPDKKKQETQMEVMSTMFDLFKTQIQPAVWVAFITIPFFLWAWWVVKTGQIAQGDVGVLLPLFGEVDWNSTVIGPLRAWIFWYIICSVAFGQLIQKIFNLDINLGLAD